LDIILQINGNKCISNQLTMWASHKNTEQPIVCFIEKWLLLFFLFFGGGWIRNAV